jgi:hypothetical protein
VRSAAADRFAFHRFDVLLTMLPAASFAQRLRLVSPGLAQKFGFFRAFSALALRSLRLCVIVRLFLWLRPYGAV